MAFASGATASRDFYELALREANSNESPSEYSAEYDLPLLAPLTHGHPLLSSSTPTFNVDAFLLSRPNISLPDLRAELRDYLAVLKEELVQFISDNFAALISLRTDLTAQGPWLEKLVEPLRTVKADIDVGVNSIITTGTRTKCLLTEISSGTGWDTNCYTRETGREIRFTGRKGNFCLQYTYLLDWI